uniref:Uncharacterized protein n=1 Tax=Gallid alphaherpesvirus 2 TaxID=10390 RepID=Q15AJ6_9ALPH|nr:hypothetical protein MDV075.2 [Gallid alphaherpesvirus 2]
MLAICRNKFLCLLPQGGGARRACSVTALARVLHTSLALLNVSSAMLTICRNKFLCLLPHSSAFS